MSGYGRQIAFAASIGVVIAVAIGVGVYYLQPQLTGSYSSSTTTLPVVTICPSGVNYPCGGATNSTTGLELQLNMNSTIFTPGSSILIDIGEYNTLSKVNNVTANFSPIQNLSISGCKPDPFGIAIFKGYYTMSNISKGSSLPVFPFESCPPPTTSPNSIFTYPPQYYVFQPESYFATIFTQPQVFFVPNSTVSSTFSGPYSLRPITDSILLEGYCCANSNAVQTIPFPIGNYTLVGGDEWGSLVFLHFQVVAHQVSGEESNVVLCRASYYTVYSVESVSDSSTSGGYSTQSSSTTYTTTTSVTETIGYVSSTERNYTGTLTGAAAEWTVSACTYTTPP